MATIMIVEDEPLIALDLRDVLVGAGHRVTGPFTTLNAAIAAAQSDEFDVALLDVVLGSMHVWPVAAVIAARGLPLIASSGTDVGDDVPKELRNLPWLRKPIDAHELTLTIANLLQANSSSST